MLKIGDKVVIRHDLTTVELHSAVGVNGYMASFKGKEAKIIDIRESRNGVRLYYLDVDECSYVYDASLFERTEDFNVGDMVVSAAFYAETNQKAVLCEVESVGEMLIIKPLGYNFSPKEVCNCEKVVPRLVRLTKDTVYGNAGDVITAYDWYPEANTSLMVPPKLPFLGRIYTDEMEVIDDV